MRPSRPDVGPYLLGLLFTGGAFGGWLVSAAVFALPLALPLAVAPAVVPVVVLGCCACFMKSCGFCIS